MAPCDTGQVSGTHQAARTPCCTAHALPAALLLVPAHLTRGSCRWLCPPGCRDPIPLPMEIASWQMQDNFTELGRTGETVRRRALWRAAGMQAHALASAPLPCALAPATQLRVSPCAALPQKLKFEWAWAVPSLIKCGVRRRMPPEIAAALSYKRVVFIGDAHVRRVHNWLAWALLGEGGHWWQKTCCRGCGSMAAGRLAAPCGRCSPRCLQRTTTHAHLPAAVYRPWQPSTPATPCHASASASTGEEVPDPKKGRAPKDLRQSIAVGDIRLELYNRDYVDGIIGMLQGW